MVLDPTDPTNQITKRIIGAAIDVHRELGPGLLESAYQACLEYDLARKGVPFVRQVALPLTYQGMRLDCGYRIDFVVEEKVIIEVKSVDGIAPIHYAQVITYLKLGNWPVGLLLNFNVAAMHQGTHRIENRSLGNPKPRSPRSHLGSRSKGNLGDRFRDLPP